MPARSLAAKPVVLPPGVRPPECLGTRPGYPALVGGPHLCACTPRRLPGDGGEHTRAGSPTATLQACGARDDHDACTARPAKISAPLAAGTLSPQARPYAGRLPRDDPLCRRAEAFAGTPTPLAGWRGVSAGRKAERGRRPLLSHAFR